MSFLLFGMKDTDGPGLSDFERKIRNENKQLFRPLVDREELEETGLGFTWDMRKAEVEGHTEVSASRQFRLKQISG